MKLKLVTIALLFIQCFFANANHGFSEPYKLPLFSQKSNSKSFEQFAKCGFSTHLSASTFGVSNRASFSADVSMSWDKSNFYFVATINDDSICFDNKAPFGKNDGIELFLSKRKGTNEMVQYLLALDPSNSESKGALSKMDYRTGSSSINPAGVRVEKLKSTDSYFVRITVPFSELNYQPNAGDTIAVNFYLNDVDGKSKPTKYSWHYNDDTYLNRDAMYEFVLSNSSKKVSQRVTTRAWLQDTTQYVVKLFAEKLPKHKELKVLYNNELIEESVFYKKSNASEVSINFSKSLIANSFQPISIYYGKNQVSTIFPADVPNLYIQVAKPNRFENEIRIFEKNDLKSFPPANAVLFIGSSSIRMWRTLPEDFPEIKVINRGFGGSQTADALHFFNRIVLPYRPKAIVYYSGTNDLGAGIDEDSIVKNTELFIKKVKQELPGTKVIVLSNVMAVSRKHLPLQFAKANELLQIMIRKYDNAVYVDVSKGILDENGQPKPELFLNDKTHLNADGYKIWKAILKPILVNFKTK